MRTLGSGNELTECHIMRIWALSALRIWEMKHNLGEKSVFINNRYFYDNRKHSTAR